MGGRPYGYKPLMEETRNIDDKGKLKINEDEAKVIVRIFEERAQGKSPRLIAADSTGTTSLHPVVENGTHRRSMVRKDVASAFSTTSFMWAATAGTS